MLKLIIFTQEAVAERALEYPPAMIPNAPLALLTNGVRQRADAGMTGETTSPVTYPGFAMIAYSSHHSQTRGENSRMAHYAISGLQHALDLTAVCTYGQPL